MPFDILSGDTTLREAIASGKDLVPVKDSWTKSYEPFLNRMKSVAHYPEEQE
jgi:hypothetical protein